MKSIVSLIGFICISLSGCGESSTEPGQNPGAPYPDSVIAVITVGSSPRDICITPDGLYVYVANAGSNNISVIDTGSLQVIETTDVPGQPNGICANTLGGFVYVACMTGNSIAVIQTDDHQLYDTVPSTGQGTRDICCLPSGEYVYVANYITNDIDVLRTNSNTIVTTIEPGIWPEAICSSPNGLLVYCINSGSGSSPNGSVVAIETENNTIQSSLEGFDGSPSICCLPSGDVLYAGNWHWQNYYIVSIPDMIVLDTLESFNSPNNLAATPSGSYIFFDTNLRVVRTSDNADLEELLPGKTFFGICFSPSGNRVYAACTSEGVVYVLE